MHELQPQDRLTTTDEEGRRLYVYPADVSGIFYRWRQFAYGLLILIFLAGPWLKISGRQAILLDIINRKFVLFGITFWAHDAPLLFFIFCGGALVLGFITAIWGRVWCGWACPQTVFIEGVFRKFERWIEGNHIEQQRFHAAPMSARKFLKLTLKWSLFLASTLVMTHSFLAYFVGTEELGLMIRSSPAESPIGFIFMFVSTGLLLFNFGWFREQFCTIACPYGRFQSILMDDHSINVAYDQKRGEPRKGTAMSGDAAGDCISCNRCVVVCPTGIDIRRGTQMECIACTACIDACDEIMEKIKKPHGLIRYASASSLAGGLTRHVRARTLIYLLLTSILFLGLGARLLSRGALSATFARPADASYQVIEDDDNDDDTSVVNHFTLDITNQSSEAATIALRATKDFADKDIHFVTAVYPISLQSGERSRLDVFVQFEKKLLINGVLRIPMEAYFVDHPEKKSGVHEELTLVGPFH
jgi:cytochrome c oxidase accessory protein FixG